MHLDQIQSGINKYMQEELETVPLRMLAKVAMSVFTVPLCFAVADMDPTNRAALLRGPAPDNVLADIAALPSQSENGTTMISSAIDAKGWFSVEEVYRFLNIERESLRQQAKSSTKGLEALKARLRAA
jgi:hypothetical protein